MGTETDNLRMFHTGAHPCGYWEGHEARDLVLDPRDPRLPQAYPMALD
jgi:arginine-tRNA-protein transferase